MSEENQNTEMQAAVQAEEQIDTVASEQEAAAVSSAAASSDSEAAETSKTEADAGAGTDTKPAAGTESVAETAADTGTAADAETAAEAAAAPSASKSAESMDDYSREIDASFKTVEEGDIMTGTVIGVSETDVTVDLRYYTEGIIRAEDYSNDPSFSIKADVQIGDEVSATVLRADDGHGHILLSRKAADDVLAWDKLKAMMDDKKDIEVKVAGVVNAGVVAYVEGIRGFIPASKLALGYVEDLNEYLQKTLQVRVITCDPEKKKLVLSARDILREKADEARRDKISNVEIGLVTEGTVETLMPYGAFVDLGDGLSGLVHISQISQKRLKHPKEVLTEGDKVKVKVIALKEGKISLSMKALDDSIAESVVEEKVDLPKSEALTTNLGSLFANIKLDQ